jgi:hypothetical protein
MASSEKSALCEEVRDVRRKVQQLLSALLTTTTKLSGPTTTEVSIRDGLPPQIPRADIAMVPPLLASYESLVHLEQSLSSVFVCSSDCSKIIWPLGMTPPLAT